jgi:hypothetical protein
MGPWIGLAFIFAVPGYLGYSGYGWTSISLWIIALPLLNYIFDLNRAITNYNLYREFGFISLRSVKLFLLLRLSYAVMVLPIYLGTFYIAGMSI